MSAAANADDFDDEFGDFEEAPTVEEKKADVVKVEEDEVVESSEWTPPIVPQKSIVELIDNDSLWDLETGIENVETEAKDHELFASFRFDSSQFSSTVESASDVWSRLRIGEGVSALQFQWRTSKSCSQFVAALPLHQPKEGARIDYRLDEIPEEEQQQYVSLQSLSATHEYDSQKSNSGVNLEDLNSSPAPLDYKVFETSTRINHQSVLEQELGALGLGDVDRNHKSPPKSNGTFHQKAAESPAKVVVHRPRYLCVDELNQEAQQFYEQMPDLHFMLSTTTRVNR